MSATTNYRPDVDGLRALAVVPVVLFHAHVPGLSGGFVGVDIFFVISGYLICSLIAAELNRGDFSIIRFYERRCRRILPALFAMFSVCLGIATFVLLPPDMAAFCRSMLAATFFVSNIYFWGDSGYFEGAAEYKPLLHTWTLGVEEQFYIFVPLILLAIAKWSKSRYASWLLAFSILSFALSVWGLTHAPTATFYLLPTRFWELGLGALVGLGLSRHSAPRVVREIIGVVGLGLIVYALTMLSEETSFPGWNALFPCLGAGAIIYAGSFGQTTVLRAMSFRPMIFVGRISYSLYLWHWPLLALAKYQAGRELTSWEIAGVLLVALIAAVVSWFYIETPVRRNMKLFNKEVVFTGAGALMVLSTIVALSGIASQGFSGRFPEFQTQVIPGKERYNNHTCFLSQEQAASAWNGDECFLTRGRGPAVLLWGDSYAAHYAPGIADQPTNIRADFLQYTASGCPPIFDYYTAARPNCRDFNDNVPHVLDRYGIRTVVMAGRWESLFKRGVTPEAVAATVRRLNEKGVKVYVIGQSPGYYNDVQTIYAKNRYGPQAEKASAPLCFSRDVNGKLQSALPRDVFIDPLPTLCNPTECVYREHGQYLMADQGHFSVFGSKVAVSRYFPFFSGR